MKDELMMSALSCWGTGRICLRLKKPYKRPLSHRRFSLLARIRAARGFSTLEGRRQLVRVRLSSLIILMQANPDHGMLHLSESCALVFFYYISLLLYSLHVFLLS